MGKKESEVSAERIAPRRPWLAGLLQLVLPGLGNVYSGRPVRGLVLHAFGQVIGLAALLAIVRLPAFVNLLIPLLMGIGLTVFIVVDGVRCARHARPDYRLARYNRWYVYVLIMIVVPLIKFAVGPDTKDIAQANTMSSASMHPAVLSGDHVFVDRLAYAFTEPKRGDIAVYIAPRLNVPFAKRIIGLPGETIEIHDKVVFINGRKLDEPYAHFVRGSKTEEFPGDSMDPMSIPPDTYFIMGDNRDNSNDSRFSGPVQRGKILGKARTVFLSRDLDTGKIRWDRFGVVLK